MIGNILGAICAMIFLSAVALTMYFLVGPRKKR
jgi:hypothetical protein